MSTLTVQTSRANSGNKSASKISPLSVNISPTGHVPNKPLTSSLSTSGSLLSSFQHSDRQPTHRPYGSQPTSPYKPGSSLASLYGPRVESSPSTGHTIPGAYHVSKPSQPTGLLMQANPSDVNTSYATTSTVTSVKVSVNRTSELIEDFINLCISQFQQCPSPPGPPPGLRSFPILPKFFSPGVGT